MRAGTHGATIEAGRDVTIIVPGHETNLSHKVIVLYLRMALGAGFLSAVADRFGWWGSPGAALVSWGNFRNFLSYTARLNPWVPSAWIPAVGWVATLCEIVFGAALILGYRTRITAFLSGLLTLVFALGMVIGLGVKAPLIYSVFAVSAGSFLLATVRTPAWSLDALIERSPVKSSHIQPGPSEV